VILVIDTSSRVAVVATLDGTRTETFLPARSAELTPTLRRIAASGDITRVAVGTGPGSFTGLRVGVSFGLGLAIGLGVPIVPLPSLEMLAARSDVPVTAVNDAGRGRFYFLAPGRKPALGEAADIPRNIPIVDSFKPEKGLRSFAEAAEILLRTAREVPYRSLEIEYMQSFTAKR
ncbi:MAG TPA: tRNA (adenosine(37)-N6)-threonylcarbamoyltransferase complex dimerization subunit type 1 TsaB, partial [Candidatus Dormibacteraeota bacterium]|nr:tRNA (adenosine(37)-N6)-threonylcarbamoyltransferase complex dimerization subunit type 1 TsaB [Candidatus Dormibacteraeota bacterium]